MTRFSVLFFVSFMALGALANPGGPGSSGGDIISSAPENATQVSVFSVKDSVVLGQNASKDLEVRAVSIYSGQSTDFGPAYELYVTFFDGGETNNVKTSFYLGRFFGITSHKRKEAGVYIISAIESEADTHLPKPVVLEIDTRQVFRDNAALELEEFEDPYFQSNIKVDRSQQSFCR